MAADDVLHDASGPATRHLHGFHQLTLSAWCELAPNVGHIQGASLCMFWSHYVEMALACQNDCRLTRTGGQQGPAHKSDLRGRQS